MRVNLGNIPLHIFLFLITVFTTLMAGTELVSGKSFFWGPEAERLTFGEIGQGWQFSFAFLLFLTVHEFGHYLTAVYHRVKCSLPYYIPVFFPFMPMNIGSFGAVIRIRELPGSRRKYFDIGVAGPLAGFVVAVGLLVYGFATLPPMEEYVLNIHPDYVKVFDGVPTMAQMEGNPFALGVGSNLLFEFLRSVVPGDPAQVPPAFEVMHYPFIFVGYLTLFFTALNLLPIGQLDGGHVIYGLFGPKRAGIVSRVAVFGLLFIGGTGVMTLDTMAELGVATTGAFLGLEALKFALYGGLVYLVVYRIFKKWHVSRVILAVLGILIVQLGLKLIFPSIQANEIWLLFAFLSVVMVGVDHPVSADETPLDLPRKILGWIAIIIFILCFSPSPLYPL